MIDLQDVAQFLDGFFQIEQYENDPGGIYRSSDRPIRRLGLALEPSIEMLKWVDRRRIDALFLHRPWKLEELELASDIGIVSYHLAFDERLTLGFNLRLAEAIALANPEPFAEKEGRSIGMIGTVKTQSGSNFARQINDVFRGYHSVSRIDGSVSRVAIVGAMNDALVREAAARGVGTYITGQFRKTAEEAVSETGMNVIEVGHYRCEQWGLRALRGVLQERWATLGIRLWT